MDLNAQVRAFSQASWQRGRTRQAHKQRKAAASIDRYDATDVFVAPLASRMRGANRGQRSVVKIGGKAIEW